MPTASCQNPVAPPTLSTPDPSASQPDTGTGCPFAVTLTPNGSRGSPTPIDVSVATPVALVLGMAVDGGGEFGEQARAVRPCARTEQPTTTSTAGHPRMRAILRRLRA